MYFLVRDRTGSKWPPTFNSGSQGTLAIYYTLMCDGPQNQSRGKAYMVNGLIIRLNKFKSTVLKFLFYDTIPSSVADLEFLKEISEKCKAKSFWATPTSDLKLHLFW